MNGIECGDPELQAAMALVKNNDGADGKMHNFEKTASFIIPANPVARHTTGDNKRGQAEVSGVTANEETVMSSTVGGKVARGKTGIEFRFYKFPEFKNLTPDQKKELKEWRQKN
eukprot:2497568-Ditylum_brightwellii.AAC.1